MLKQLVNKYVFFPFLGTAFIFGLMLLFFRDLDSTFRNILVPAFAIYVIGTLLLGYLYFELDVINCVRAAKNKEKPGPQPTYIIWIFRFLHVILFLLLMIHF